MKRKIYWKDIAKSFSSSKGRFLSIFCLMMLGSLALVGLKVTTPNMRRTALDYLKQQRTMDLAVMADYGLDAADQKELEAIKGADVEFGYLTDVTVKDQALRVFSNTEKISTFKVTAGRLPKTEQEIALASFWSDQYKLGQEIKLAEKEGQASVLKHQAYKIVGFVQSAELWSDKNLGNANSGSGNLDAYAILAPEAFSSNVYSIARLRYQDLADLDSFARIYQDKLAAHQEQLNEKLKDNGAARLKSLQANATASIQAGAEKIKNAEADIAQGQKQLEQVQAKLEEQEKKLNQAATSGLLAEESLASSRSELEQGKTQLAQKKKDLEQATAELKSRKVELQQAQADLAGLAKPAYHSYTRKSLPGSQGYLMYSNATNSIAAVANIFPVVLYLVAAMVTFTTMTRFVDEERTNAGVFKALGYHSRDIIRKFAIYGLVAGSLGTLVGIFLGHYFFSGIISRIITQGMVVGQSRLYFYPFYSLLALGLAFLSSVLPAYLVARRELTEEAAHLLLPKPPVKGSTILLERFPFIWKRLSFTHKVTARNIFRYKLRMLMTIFGVAGSVALLFAGLGIRSSISGVPHRQFEQILSYDLIISEKSQADRTAKLQLEKKLKDPAISDYQSIFSQSFEEVYQGSKNKETVILMATDKADFSPFIRLESQENQEKLTLAKGAVISAKLAKIAGVSVGDRLELDGKKIPVAAINENYVGHFVFMSQADYESVFGQKASNNAYIVKLKNRSEKATLSQARDFMKLSAVRGVSQNTSMVEQFNTLATSLNSTMLVLVIVSILLAIVILYNLTNINVAERIRELSTIKVLGFHSKEVTLYIYRETILLSLMGIGTGLLAGFYLHRFLIQMIAPSFIAFNPQVGWEVYLLPILAVSFILTLLGFFVNYQLKRLDMLEALKSVD